MRIVFSSLSICFLLLAPSCVAAQDAGLPWLTDLEAAKAEARQSGRLVLVHFWTPDCKPCAALNRDVFSQPQVVAAMQQAYVPVKINALESRATADALGVTRVPTDVILSPEGKVIDREISPNSPMAYISYLQQTASTHKFGPGSAYDAAVAQAPVKVPNEAYAQLNIPPGGANQLAPGSAATVPTTPASMPTAIANPYAAVVPTASAPAAQSVNTAMPTVVSAQGPTSASTATTSAVPPIGDRYAMNSSVTATPTMNPYAAVAATQPTAPPAVTQQIPVASVPAVAGGGGLATNPIYPPSAMGTAPTPGAVQQLAPQIAAAPTLPPGSPQLGFDGFCPVTMKRQWQWAPGDVRFGAVHRDRTYLFANQACRDEFMANPDAYSPALSGLDPVLHLEQSQSVPGKRQYALEYKGHFYLFSNEQTLNRFWQNADQYTAGVQQAMQLGQGRIVR